MPVPRPLCAVLASLTLAGAFWIPGAQVAPPGIAAPADDAVQDPAELPPFAPVARISSLMSGIGSAFGQVREIFPLKDNEHRHRVIMSQAEVIAELSNVHTRHRRKPSYLAMAADTRDIALELGRAARASTPDESLLATLIAKLDTSCSTCHDAQQ